MVTYGDEQVARFEWTSGVSKDPIVSFTLTADKEAPLTMVWTDNKGGVYRQSVDHRLRRRLDRFRALALLARPAPVTLSPR